MRKWQIPILVLISSICFLLAWVNPLKAERVTNGLLVLYTFDEGFGTIITDISGVGVPLNLTIADPENTTWVTGGLSINSSTIIPSGVAATKIIDACMASNAITVEAWIKPANSTQGGPARIVTLSLDSSNGNFTLGQQQTQYHMRLRTEATTPVGIPSLVTPIGQATTDLTHVAFTRDAAGNRKIYINKTEVIGNIWGGDFSNWDTNYEFALANELAIEIDRTWLGEIYLVAVYERALSPTEIEQNYTDFQPTAELRWVAAPAAFFNRGTQNNLVAQLNYFSSSFNFLRNLSVENDGSAVAATDISHLTLWHRSLGSTPGITFDPLQSTPLGTLSAVPEAKKWYIVNLNQKINYGDAFYISADINYNAQEGRTCKFAVPANDVGFLLGSSLPPDRLVSSTLQTIIQVVHFSVNYLAPTTIHFIRGETKAGLGAMVFTNVSEDILALNSILLNLVDENNKAQTLDTVFDELRLEQAGVVLASLSPPFPSESIFQLSSPLIFSANEQKTVEIKASIKNNPQISRFRIGLPHSLCMNSGKLVLAPIQGQSFPLLTNPLQIREAELAAVFTSYPNPFPASQTQLKINYYLKQPGKVRLEVISQVGKLVKVLTVSEKAAELIHQVVWDGRNDRGYKVKSNVYLLRIKINYADGTKEQIIRKIVVVR